MRALHAADLAAGAQWLTSATFSATEADAIREALASACSFDVPVMASLGPIGTTAQICARAELCLRHGAALIALETFVDGEALCDVLQGLRGVPVLASYCPLGNAIHAPELFLEAGADVLGVNCGDELDGLVDAAIELLPLKAEVVLRPSAGLPDAQGEYPVTPAKFAAALERAWDAGVHAAGGCCGVQPAHLSCAAARR